MSYRKLLLMVCCLWPIWASADNSQYLAHIQPAHVRKVVAPTDGHIAETCVTPGHWVHKDEVLFVIENPLLAVDLKDAQIKQQQKQKAYEKLQHWESSYKFLETQNQYHAAKEQLDLAKEKFEGTARLYQLGIVSREECLMDKRQMQYAIDACLRADQYFQEMKEQGDMLALQAANNDMLKADLEVTNIQKLIHQQKIKSPATGLFTPYSKEDEATTHVQIGDAVSQDTILGLVAESEYFDAVFTVTEFEMTQFKVGQTGHVQLLFDNQYGYQGQINAVESMPRARQAAQLAEFQVKVRFKVPAEHSRVIKAGMSATIELA